MDVPVVDWQAACLLEFSIKKAGLVNDLSLLGSKRKVAYSLAWTGLCSVSTQVPLGKRENLLFPLG